MTTLHIANATQQFHEFAFRLGGTGGAPIIQTIPPGGQIRVAARGGNLSTEDVDAIVKQHEPYGLIPVSEVGKRDGFCGLCYSVDRPVSFSRLAEQIGHNRMALISRGKENRKAAAVAINETLEANIRESGRTDVLRTLQIEVEQLNDPQVLRVDKTTEGLAREMADTPRFGEGVRVDRNAPPPAAAKRARAPRRKS